MYTVNITNWDNGTAQYDNNNLRHTAGLFFFLTIMTKKIDNTCTYEVENRSIGCNNINTAGLFFLPTIMAKKIDNHVHME